MKAAAGHTVVAVLERRGRFWTAEPLFPARDRDDRAPARPPGRTRGARRMTLGASLAGDAGREARPGDLVLLAAAAQSGGVGGDRTGQAGRDAHARRAGCGAGGERLGVARVIGRPDVARDVIEALLLDRGLPRGFDAAVEREARAAAERGFGGPARPAGSGGPGGRGRVDLRGLATFTIDPTSARDFDDAVSAQRIEGGGVRVWVHIADVSAYVPEGSLVDREARRRATSVYVPGAVEPMLPDALSGDACSLVPGRDRAAVTVELQLHDGRVRQTAFYRSTIRSDERLDYDRVDRIFAGHESAAEPWGQPLAAAREAARALAQARERRGGALTLDASEPEFRFDEHGHVSEIARRAQTESHRLIEHLMIAANEAVARALAQRGTPCLYRVHERPEPASVERLVDQLATLGVPTPPVPKQMSATEAAELMGEISRLVEAHIRRTAAERRSAATESGSHPAARAAGAPPSGGRPALTSLVLRALRQAYYSPRNIGHAGLGSECYCHFTSPIRRYPDLVCHRALLSSIGADERAPRGADLGELGEWTSQRERAAMEIERDADDVARCFALEQELYEGGWEQVLAGEVVGLISAGAFVAFGPVPPATADPATADPATADPAAAGGDGTDPRVPPAAAAGLTTVDSDGTDPRVPPYEGMLPVRRLAAAGRDREWWELNEQGTILRGERTGATLRLGDPIAVRVRGVDAPRGRVDLAPARDEPRAAGPAGRSGSRRRGRLGS